ncbi:MAG: sensor domain-containing protein [Actinomycetota bacterium]|nr:sensor domain-containing protein [Actinomycetota bacterium]
MTSWEGPGTGAAQPRRSRRGSWFIGAAIAVAVIVVAVLLVSAYLGPASDRGEIGRYDATPGARPTAAVPADALPGYLLTAEEVGTVLQTDGMVTGRLTEALTSDGSVAPHGCANAWAPADRSTYRGYEYTGLARQSVTHDPRDDTAVVEAAISFADAATPKAVVEQMRATWAGCAGKTFITDLGDGRPVMFMLKSRMDDDDVTTLFVRPPASAPGPTCQRAVTARRNVVVDVLACSPTAGNFGAMIAAAIATKIS